MKDGDKSKKNRAILGIIWVGALAIMICIVVSIVLVLSLQDTYRKQVSAEFHAQHITTGDNLNRMLYMDGEELLRIAGLLEDVSEEELPVQMVHVISISNFSDIYLVHPKEGLYHNSRKPREINVEAMLGVLDDLDFDETGIYIGEAPALVQKETDKAVFVCTRIPAEDDENGYLFVPIDLEALFETEAFAYQLSMGECLVVNTSGSIVAGSRGSVIVGTNAENFQLGLLEYSDGRETSKQAWQAYDYDVAKSAGGFTNIITRDGYRMQLSYSPLKSAHALYFVSLYKDNMVDGKLQPLIFGSVLACIIIIVLMMGSLAYVWGTAKRTNMTVERLAYEDPVTGGKNLNYFREFALNAIISHRETPFVIYRFDIANFRYVNESYGHHRADKVLVSCIQNFAAKFSDMELCVRIDADQFLALLVNDSLLDKRLDEFTNDVNADARGYGIKYPIRFKYGIYQIKKQDHDIDVMIDHANVARKTISSDSREAKVTYSERIVDDMRKVDHIESQQQKALAEGEFKVYLQPKWDIYANKITGAEALVRWVHSDGSVTQPDQFIPVFENNGFIETLDFYTLESVCMRMHELIEEGVEILPVSVNQSRLLLHSPDYVENVEKILKQYKVPAGAIELEITESVFDNEREEMIGIVHRLKLLGVRLSMDDFGAGYSSLKMLTEVPFDVIKIDGGFFAGSAQNDKERLIVSKIVELVEGLGMEVVCEGVESEDEVGFLQKIGCRKVQGFYFARPISEPDFIKKYYKNAKAD